MVLLAGIPHVQQHVEVLLFRSSFEGEAMHVNRLLPRYRILLLLSCIQ